MRSLRDLAGAGMQSLRDLAAAVEHAADNAVEAAGLLASIFDSTVRLVRTLTSLLGVLFHGARRVAFSVVHLMDVVGRLRNLFAPGSLDLFRQHYRREDRLLERELNRRARERDVADAEAEMAHRRRAQRRPRRRRRRHRDSDGYTSTSSSGSSTEFPP